MTLPTSGSTKTNHAKIIQSTTNIGDMQKLSSFSMCKSKRYFGAQASPEWLEARRLSSTVLLTFTPIS